MRRMMWILGFAVACDDGKSERVEAEAVAGPEAQWVGHTDASPLRELTIDCRDDVWTVIAKTELHVDGIELVFDENSFYMSLDSVGRYYDETVEWKIYALSIPYVEDMEERAWHSSRFMPFTETPCTEIPQMDLRLVDELFDHVDCASVMGDPWISDACFDYSPHLRRW